MHVAVMTGDVMAVREGGGGMNDDLIITGRGRLRYLNDVVDFGHYQGCQSDLF